MPPKKGSAKAKADTPADPKIQPQPVKNSQPSKKRKQPTETNEPQKAPRRSMRSSHKPQPSQRETQGERQLLNYLLSASAEELLRPDEETKVLQTNKNISRTYTSSTLNAFEELLCAIILSRPISHRLGLRTIRTVLNPPYNFTGAKAVNDAGETKVHQAIWDAKTQHKAKTAEEILKVADVVLNTFLTEEDSEGTDMGRLLQMSGGDVGEAAEILKREVKGFGDTGAKIFRRRVQWLFVWKTGYPYVDDRTALSLGKLGLPGDAEELRKLLERRWRELDTANVTGDDVQMQKRRAFVVVLERAIGADLEGKVDALLEAADSAAE